MNRRRQAVGKFYGLLALTAAIWGIQPLFIKLAVREITPVSLTVVRFVLISATIFLIMRWRHRTPLLPLSRRSFRSFAWAYAAWP